MCQLVSFLPLFIALLVKCNTIFLYYNCKADIVDKKHQIFWNCWFNTTMSAKLSGFYHSIPGIVDKMQLIVQNFFFTSTEMLLLLIRSTKFFEIVDLTQQCLPNCQVSTILSLALWIKCNTLNKNFSLLQLQGWHCW